MKKKILIPLLLIFFSETFVFAHQGVGFNWGLLTGLPVYSDQELLDSINKISKDTPNRAVVGTFVDLTVGLSEILALYGGAQARCDFLWNSDEYFHDFDLNFFGGLKVSPWDFGLIFSVAYAPGFRTTFYDFAEEKGTSNSSWGNGFRVGVEYDILYTFDVAVSPAVGVLYEFFPRGDYTYDNLFSFYVALKF